jgi:hypothetical protein
MRLRDPVSACPAQPLGFRRQGVAGLDHLLDLFGQRVAGSFLRFPVRLLVLVDLDALASCLSGAVDTSPGRLSRRYYLRHSERVEFPNAVNGRTEAEISEKPLMLLRYSADFDSAIRRFDSSRQNSKPPSGAEAPRIVAGAVENRTTTLVSKGRSIMSLSTGDEAMVTPLIGSQICKPIDIREGLPEGHSADPSGQRALSKACG